MARRINNKLWNNFIELISTPKNTDNYFNYYNALISFLKKNKKFIRKELFKVYNLDILINLDPFLYIKENPDLNLEEEKTYIFKKPRDTQSFILDISNKLERMIVIESDKECPSCVNQGILQYFYTIDTNVNNTNVIKGCDTCYYQESLDGNIIEKYISNLRPANKYDLEKAGIKLNKLL